MPVYEYQCVDNGHRFDLHQSVGAEAPACPLCGSPTRRVYTSVGLIFKGSGFHVTDYRRPETADRKADGKPDEKPPAPASDGGASGASGAAKAGSEDASAGSSKKAPDA